MPRRRASSIRRSSTSTQRPTEPHQENTMRFFADLNLSTKIVMLVSLLGALAAFTTGYSMNTLQQVDARYRYLLNHNGQSSSLAGDALLDLSDASRLLFSVLTEEEERQMRTTQQNMRKIASDFQERMEEIRPLIPEQSERLRNIQRQQLRVFELAEQIIDDAARWRGDRALMIIKQDFEPALHQLRYNMDTLRYQLNDDYLKAAETLRRTSRTTLIAILLAFSLAVLLSIGLASYFSMRHISRPINQLTRTMTRLTANHYDDEISGTERKDEVGQMAKALQVFRDTMLRAERLEQEAMAATEIRRLSQQLVDLADAIPGAVFQLQVDEHGDKTFTFASSKLEQMLGPIQGGIGQPVAADTALFPHTAEYQKAARQAFRHSLKDLTPIDFDIHIQNPDGGFWVKTLATVQRQPDDKTLFNCILLDVSEMHRQAEALQEAKEQAEQAAEAKANFLAVMSHEIRTPMNAILGLARALLRQPVSGRQRERLEQIIHAGRHLQGIIDDILDFSRSDSGHLQLEHIVFTPRRLLDELTDMFSEEVARKGLVLSTEISAETPQQLKGDPLRIGQILINFTNNAIKFSDKGRIHIHLALHADATGALFLYGSVDDQGIGISPAQRAQLFQPFHQADASISRRFGGTGLGLSISRNLAKMMGGEVGAESMEGIGSRFWFRVRVEEAGDDTAQSAPPPLEIPPLPRHYTGLRLLLVDDNELNRQVAGELLQEAGFEVDMADNGEQAIAILQAAADGTYAVVLMDMMMPLLDGLSATRLLREQPRFDGLPIIALSANARPQDMERCLQAGMQGHIAKPIDERQLWSVLDSCLAREARPMMAPSSQWGMLERLRASMSAERFAALLRMLVDDCRQRSERIQALAREGAIEALDQEAHDMLSAVGSAGLSSLTTLAERLGQAVKSSDLPAIRDLARQIASETASALEYLQNHFGPADGPASDLDA
ncbi:two-component system sensor histidine kinase/response regulator [Stutzerimonas kirkiae]|nr:two-component system sensor histidine kinase/response regulator [Stutzerimonas kirkiae]